MAARKPDRISASEPGPQPLKISPEFVPMSRGATKGASGRVDVFAPYVPAPGVLPKRRLAMDAAGGLAIGWASGDVYANDYVEYEHFLGYPQLSILAQRPEYRIVCETIAMEMTRKWIRFRSTDESNKSEKIEKIEEELERLGVRSSFREVAEHDGFFGRAHLFIDFGDAFDGPELKLDIGDGANDASQLKTKGRRIKGIKTVEPIWVYPAGGYNATNPLAADWYKPRSWFAMGKEVHASRLLCFVGREVPDILKAAYAFGGVPLTQMLKPYVENWLRTRQSVSDILQAFSTFVLKTNMQAILQSGASAEGLFARLDAFNNIRNNRGVMAIDKELEEFINVSVPISGLDKLQAQAQEQICSIAKMPLIKYTGISPTGLNASSEGELQSFDDNTHAYQESFFRPNLTKVINFVQMSLFGEIDPTIEYEFAELRELSDNERADIATKIATAISAAHEGAIIDTPTAMEELKKSSDTTGIFASISDEAILAARANPPALTEAIAGEGSPNPDGGVAQLEEAEAA